MTIQVHANAKRSRRAGCLFSYQFSALCNASVAILMVPTFSLRFIASGRAAVVGTALTKVKRALVADFAARFVPVDSESFRELTDGARFDMLAR
jgi:hypothetical protein